MAQLLDDGIAQHLPMPAGIDDFGFDPQFTERMEPFFRFLFDRYWRVEVEGLENVPAKGRALLVANHAGVIPWDGAMIRTAIWTRHSHPRHARMLVVDWAFSLPYLGRFLRQTGNVLAHPDNASELLERNQLVGVFPEGVKGAAKPYRDRYRVGRLGRGGFVQVALRTGSPIIPIAVVGSEEIHPILFDLPALAHLLRLPSFPITPSFPLLGVMGLIPLPSKWLISFGDPIPTLELGPDAADDPALVLDLSDHVREVIQNQINKMLPRRHTPFS